MKHTILAITLAGAVAALALPAVAEEQVAPPRLKWSFAGPFGKYDEAQLQRGFKIYKEVCAVCHSLEMLAFRNLAEPGGPGFTEAQAATVAADAKIKDLDDKGQPIERPGRLADYFPSPFPNELAAAAVHGVAPPDMSTLAKARTYQRGFPWLERQQPRWSIDHRDRLCPFRHHLQNLCVCQCAGTHFHDYHGRPELVRPGRRGPAPKNCWPSGSAEPC
jgi:cytochrome c1